MLLLYWIIILYSYLRGERKRGKKTFGQTWQIDILNISLWQIPSTAQNGIVLFFFEKWTGIWTGRIMLQVFLQVQQLYFLLSERNYNQLWCKSLQVTLTPITTFFLSQRFLAHLSKWFSNLDIVEHAELIIFVCPIPPNTSIWV